MAIFIPELASPFLLKEIGKRLVISKAATDISATIPEIKWQGDKINFPVFVRTAVADVIAAKGSAAPTEIDGNSSTADIKHYASSIKFHKDAIRTSGAMLADMAVIDLADSIALKLDADMMSAAIAGAVKKSPCAVADTITDKELEAGLALFGDKQNADEFDSIVINSKLFPSILAMTGFSSTGLTYTTAQNGIIQGQMVGFYRGIPIKLTDNANRTGTQPECKTLIIKKGALGFAQKQGVEFAEAYDNVSFYTTITADSYAAQKVLDTDKIVLIAKTIV